MRPLRLASLALALGLGTGCMSLDFMFRDAPTTKAYDVEPTIVPEELIEWTSFDRGDGVVLQGVWLRQDDTVDHPPMIFFHGAYNHLGMEFDRTEFYWSFGRYDVFAVDYAGFGASEGEASWESLTEKDGVATLDYVSELTGYATEDIPVVGLSLGGYVALHAIDERPVQALVTESTFANADFILDTSLQLDVPEGWFMQDHWDSVEAARAVKSPVFVIHGLADDFVDPRSGPMIHDALNGPSDLWQPKQANHADLYKVDGDGYRDRALAWFDRFVP